MAGDKVKVVVTGGGGFLGKALCLRLIKENCEVHSIARSDYPELRAAGIVTHQADLSQPLEKISEQLASVFAGAAALFHTAAKVEMWGDYADFYAANVRGTENMISVCKSARVPSLIFTSSPSVIANGSHLRGVNETIPYPAHYEAFYPQTKAQAERLVLAADDAKALRTVSLRPHLIWGPGDTNLVPTILERAKSGRLVQVGDGRNRVDLSFIDDCVEAHICAWRALQEGRAVSGKSYFISQDEPVVMWDWINQVLEANRIPRVTRKISRGVAAAIARICELIVRVLPGKREPLLTRFLVTEMATDHYFDISRAKSELGYVPKFSIASAMNITFPAV